jgi:hypothetical protein
MSLEGDLLMPPRGPLKWGWFSKVISALAQRLKIISPNGSVHVSPTPSGYSLRAAESAQTPPETTAWIITPAGLNRYSCFGGNVAILDNAISILSHEVEDTFISALEGQIIAVRIQLELQGIAATRTPIFNEAFSIGDVEFLENPEIVAVGLSEFTNAQSVLPQSRSEGTIYVPLGIIKGGRVIQWAPTTNCVVLLLHQQFLISFV